jgi:ubiquinone/menaquinone biosynthesis C-methylase UbiE
VRASRWQSYDSVAGDYDRAWHASFEPVARDLLDFVAPAPQDAVLDVGTGTGVVAATAAEDAERGVVVGVDPSLPMLRRAHAHTTVPLAAGRTPGLPFPAQTFDVAWQAWSSRT